MPWAASEVVEEELAAELDTGVEETGVDVTGAALVLGGGEGGRLVGVLGAGAAEDGLARLGAAVGPGAGAGASPSSGV